jgi:DNA-directed RNA polymerase subunit H (RpoH/RPB5)
MTDEQYQQYKNLHIFARDWMKYQTNDAELSSDNFRKQMQADQYVKLSYLNSNTSRPVLIYLLEKTSKYANSSQDLKRLLTKIKEPSDVILVSYEPLKTYAMRSIGLFTHLQVKCYLHENFALIIPHGPLCYPHRILSDEEVNRLLNDELNCYLVNLPKILQSDVQCIWIGAEVGDVIEITSLSDIMGESVTYKVVANKSGKIVSFRGEAITEEKPVEDEEDDNIAEIRDVANLDNSDGEADEDEEMADEADE